MYRIVWESPGAAGLEITWENGYVVRRLSGSDKFARVGGGGGVWEKELGDGGGDASGQSREV